MRNFKKWAFILVSIPLFAACSNAPPDDTVEALIEAQYEQTPKIIEVAKANAGNDKMAKTMSAMMESLMPTLEGVENIDCDAIEGENAYRCSADVTQTIAGNSQTNKTDFKVYKLNNEWVLGD
ncbi:hypothetical protein [Psychrobacter sp.]|uniref:hypothetical protein n=1 Tax=Psychrobacter sp. TaxID=56811 RepID=UPI003562617D